MEDAELEGLYYNRYRWYNSETGCYISQDPIGLAGGLNVYAY
ncbi:MAG: RHS repeat-associated core domain-containing protein, partial [Porphyromonadaceae bacterium]|nr:RHS repeat-associated core domain-containing protein [Porphyromonadaceae bacterium]